ncbi:MAG: DUF1778 domain-containing protein [Akkermansiaceae bacterium]|jgi:uncharacterized protein (DUF1778 family)|nr:DUF1778 domain-containing protein [Akkermansiaceae bacterium]
MSTTTAKPPRKPASERLEARVPVPLKRLISRAAALEGRSITDFVIATLERHSAAVVQEHEILELSVRDSESFAKSMISPPEPALPLRAALAGHSRSISVR